jgi:hypothetical protein
MNVIEISFARWADYCVGLAVLAALTAAGWAAPLEYILR